MAYIWPLMLSRNIQTSNFNSFKSLIKAYLERVERETYRHERLLQYLVKARHGEECGKGVKNEVPSYVHWITPAS